MRQRADRLWLFASSQCESIRLFYTSAMRIDRAAGDVQALAPWRAACAVGFAVAVLTGCAATPAGDPLQSLGRTDLVPARQIVAMQMLDANPTNLAYLLALRRMIVQPGYAVELRNEAWDRLIQHDMKGLKESLELNLPKMQIYEWRTIVCRRIGELDWKDMTQTLIRGWAVVLPILGMDLWERPEYHALVTLWGKDRVPQVLFDVMLGSDPIKEANLRSRCWELLLAIGEHDRITALLADESKATTDSFILDMRRCSGDLGIIPRNREEILWIRALRLPAHRAFWDAARDAAAKLPADVRASLAPRDLAILVAVARERPELLSESRDALFAEVSKRLSKENTRRYEASFEGYGSHLPETPRGHANEMTWGDCAAVLVALDALAVPEVRRHIFDIADRDLADRQTEYGGLLQMDDQGRFELIEFAPRSRGSDVRYEASDKMFEQGYDALFHFHNHAQAYENHRYAGPHYGDFAYADATGVNGLVFTFISRNEIDADFYRRGQIVIDLGTIERPEN